MNNKGHFSFTISEIIAVLGIAIGIPALIILILGFVATKALKYFGYFPEWGITDLMLITAPTILIVLFVADNVLMKTGY